jgi:hypothetical protein
MASKEHVLLTRAAEQFPALTDAERKLLHAVPAGEIADYHSPDAAENDPQRADTWDTSNTIRAKVIRWLCVNGKAIRHVDPRGIRINGVRINGQLDLEAVTIPFPLFLTDCVMHDGVVLESAKTRELVFTGSTLGHSTHRGEDALRANGVHVDGDMQLNRRFRAEGRVSLQMATIAGYLLCSGGQFFNSSGTALDAVRIAVGGSVHLNQGFHAKGCVDLLGAKISGSLDCADGKFYAPHRTALDAERSTVGGNVSLRRSPVDGNVSLRRCFWAIGEVNLRTATITGSLDCTGGQFRNRKGSALTADGVQVSRGIRLYDGFRAKGAVVLESARVGELLDDEAGWPTPGHLRLDGFVYSSIATGPRDAKTRLAWLARQPSIPFRPQPYQQLAKVLRESGHEADAKRVLIAKERERRKPRNLSWLGRFWNRLLGIAIGYGYWLWPGLIWAGDWLGRFWNWLLWVTIGYGYRPWLALFWAGGWVAIGGFLFGWGYEKGIVIPAKAEAYHSGKRTWQEPEAYHSNKMTRQEPAFYPAFNRWLYALDTLVPIINFGQKDYWAPQVDCYERFPKRGSSVFFSLKGKEEHRKTGLIRGGGVRLCVLGIRDKPAIRVLYLYRWLHIAAGWVLITLVVTGFTNLVRKE